MAKGELLNLKPALAEKGERDAAQAQEKAIQESLKDKGLVMVISNRNSESIFKLSPEEAQRVVDFFRLNTFEIYQIFEGREGVFSPEEVLSIAQEIVEKNEASQNVTETREDIDALLDLDFGIIGRCLSDPSFITKFEAEDILKIRDYLYNKRNQQKGVLSPKETLLLKDIEDTYPFLLEVKVS